MKEKNIRKRIKTNQKGITLIALVITIIVLLILAGVAISSMSGNGNIMQKAQDASNRTKEAEELEKVQMAVVNAIAEGNTGTVSNENNLLKNKLQAMGLDVTTFGTSVNDSWKIQGSTGQWYQIYTNGKVEKTDSEPSDTTVALTGITLNPTSTNLKVGETVQIGVTLTPSNTTESGVTYTVASGGTGVATVSETGLVTAVGAGDTTITVAGKETTGVKETFTVTVTLRDGITTATSHSSTRNLTTAGIEWSKLSELSGIISDNYGAGTNQINNDTMEVTITQNGTPYVLGIGDTATVQYNSTAKTVRILGFNHDTLASDESKRAGISFEFEECLATEQMNSSNSNASGWGKPMPLKTNLNSTYIGKIKDNTNSIAMSTYIKPVTKTYNTGSQGTTNSTITDSLWLLSCSEIWPQNSDNTRYAYCYTQEGDQYKYYKIKTSGKAYSDNNTNLVKNYNGSAQSWWLRSPRYNYSGDFCLVNSGGPCRR